MEWKLFFGSNFQTSLRLCFAWDYIIMRQANFLTCSGVETDRNRYPQSPLLYRNGLEGLNPIQFPFPVFYFQIFHASLSLDANPPQKKIWNHMDPIAFHRWIIVSVSKNTKEIFFLFSIANSKFSIFSLFFPKIFFIIFWALEYIWLYIMVCASRKFWFLSCVDRFGSRCH